MTSTSPYKKKLKFSVNNFFFTFNIKIIKRKFIYNEDHQYQHSEFSTQIIEHKKEHNIWH